MKHYAALISFLVLGAACNSHSSPLPASPSVPQVQSVPSPSPSVVPEIVVGEEVTGTLKFHGAEDVFELAAPSDGTLVVRVSWQTGALLELWFADKYAAVGGSLMVGRLAVVAGQKYRVTVADGAKWDYDDFFVPYVLTASIE